MKFVVPIFAVFTGWHVAVVEHEHFSGHWLLIGGHNDPIAVIIWVGVTTALLYMWYNLE